MMDSLSPQQQLPNSLQHHHSDAPFPAKLYEMLQYVDENGLSDCVSWLSHGQSFKIHNNKKFMSDVAHLFFRATKLRSVHRQLNLWGFKRIATGKERDSWYHPCFIRGQPSEMCKMVRTKVKGNSKRRLSQKDADAQPTADTRLQQQQRRSSAPAIFDSFEALTTSPRGMITPVVSQRSGLFDLEDEAFDQVFDGRGGCGEMTQRTTTAAAMIRAELPFMKTQHPRRVSVSSPSMIMESITSSNGNIGAKAYAGPQVNAMPRATTATPGLARRNRFQGTHQDDESNWAAQAAMSANIDPLSIEPLNLETTGSSCAPDTVSSSSSSDPMGVDEFSLFIGQMIQDPN
jgi:hypothetical protein